MIFVTGGAGYIGSHTCVELLNAGFDVTVFDNFCNSQPEALARVQRITGKKLRIVQGDLRDRAALTRGLQGLAIRIAKALNKLWLHRGTVFADRYHDRILRTPREVRNALIYVLANGKKHAAEGREVAVPQAIDVFTSAPFSSAAWFDGFRETVTVRGIEAMPRPVTAARTWMLTIGWRRHGLLSVHDLPATA